MHDFRFKQMEYTLPEEYQDEAELLRQRRIHDSLITTGLELISDSYTDVMRYRCLERGVPFEARRRDGRNWEEIVTDVAEVKPDLVVMGALGTGAVRESTLGSVAERVLRRIRTDVLLVRDLDWRGRGTSSSPSTAHPRASRAARRPRAGQALPAPGGGGRRLRPYLHYAVFNGIVDVLSEKASKVFRFKEQEALHERSSTPPRQDLRVAPAGGRGDGQGGGMELPITLLDARLRPAAPPLPRAEALAARHGADRHPLRRRHGPGRRHRAIDPLRSLQPAGDERHLLPPLDIRADASVVWTPEAEERMERVPAGVRGLARTAVLRAPSAATAWCEWDVDEASTS